MIELPWAAQETGGEMLSDLATQYIEHHANIPNYTPTLAVIVDLLRRLKLEPTSKLGRIAFGTTIFVAVLAPAVILTLLAGQWAEAPLLLWTGLALFCGVVFPFALTLYRAAAIDHLAWVRTIVHEDDIRRVLAWARRWYSLRFVGVTSTLLTLAISLLMFWILSRAGAPAPAGSYYIGAFFVLLLMQNAVGVTLVVFEARELAACRHDLYRLSPADSVAVRQSLRGYNRLGVVNALLWTPLILGLLLLLPSGSGLVVPVVITLLLLEIVYTALAAFAPRVILGHVVRARKEEEMRVLQRWLDDLVLRIRELSDAEYGEMKRLQETQDAIRNSPENLLPLGAVLRTAGALLLSAITILATAFAEEWIAGVMTLFNP